MVQNIRIFQKARSTLRFDLFEKLKLYNIFQMAKGTYKHEETYGACTRVDHFI